MTYAIRIKPGKWLPVSALSTAHLDRLIERAERYSRWYWVLMTEKEKRG